MSGLQKLNELAYQEAFERERKRLRMPDWKVKTMVSTPVYSDSNRSSLIQCCVTWSELNDLKPVRTDKSLRNIHGLCVHAADFTVVIKGKKYHIRCEFPSSGREIPESIETRRRYIDKVKKEGAEYVTVTNFQEFYNWFESIR